MPGLANKQDKVNMENFKIPKEKREKTKHPNW
jgi:hypothetical protein